MLLSSDDGLIEVVGLTTYQLPLLQAGGSFLPKKIYTIKEAHALTYVVGNVSRLYQSRPRLSDYFLSFFFTCRWSPT
jgi:hypothetical protein